MKRWEDYVIIGFTLIVILIWIVGVSVDWFQGRM